MDPSGPAPVPRTGRVAELDGIRGLAILLVLVWHYFGNLVRTAPGSWLASVQAWLGLTWSGVDLFFVLSGYLLGGILLDQRASPVFFKTFYLRRACRILPIYFVLLAVAAVGLWAGWGTAGGWKQHLLGDTMPFLSYVTFTQNYFMAQARDFGGAALAATWSLAVEEQFYLFLPLLIRLIPLASLPGALILGILAGPVFRLAIWVMMDSTGAAGLVLAPARADALLLGVMLSFLVRQPEFAVVFRTRRRLFYAAGLLLGIGVLLLARFGSQVPPILAHVLGHTWLAGLFALLILLAPGSPLGAPFRGRFLVGLGAISYGTYLLHTPVLGLTHGLWRGQRPQIANAADILATLSALAITLIVATVSWRWLEQPILRFGRRHAY